MKFQLSLRNFEGLLHKRAVNLSNKSVRYGDGRGLGPSSQVFRKSEGQCVFPLVLQFKMAGNANENEIVPSFALRHTHRFVRSCAMLDLHEKVTIWMIRIDCALYHFKMLL